QHAPLDERCVRAREIEPGLRIPGGALRPRIARSDRRRGELVKGAVKTAAVGIQQNLPPHRYGRERLARFGRRWWARPGELRVDVVEPRVQNRVVDCGQS